MTPKDARGKIYDYLHEIHGISIVSKTHSDIKKLLKQYENAVAENDKRIIKELEDIIRKRKEKKPAEIKKSAFNPIPKREDKPYFNSSFLNSAK
jgi:hypothetical protein